MIIWIVMAETGEQSDSQEWPVCVHRTFEGAEAKKKMFEVWAELHSVLWYGEAGKDREYPIPIDRRDVAKATWLKLWPTYRIHIDYTGIKWDVLEVEYDPDDKITP